MQMYQLTCYVPQTHLEQVKNAMFAAGGGRIGAYDCCAWQTPGEGQFRPLAESSPYLGNSGELTQVAEYKVELVCEDAELEAVLEALLASHPYEEPAYAYWPINSRQPPSA